MPSIIGKLGIFDGPEDLDLSRVPNLSSEQVRQFIPVPIVAGGSGSIERLFQESGLSLDIFQSALIGETSEASSLIVVSLGQCEDPEEISDRQKTLGNIFGGVVRRVCQLTPLPKGHARSCLVQLAHLPPGTFTAGFQEVYRNHENDESMLSEVRLGIHASPLRL